MSLQSRSIIGECANCGHPLAPCDLDEHKCQPPQSAAEPVPDEGVRLSKEYSIKQRYSTSLIELEDAYLAGWNKRGEKEDSQKEELAIGYLNRGDDIEALKRQVAETKRDAVKIEALIQRATEAEKSALVAEVERLRKALENWIAWERIQISKYGPYAGQEITLLIEEGEKALAAFPEPTEKR